MTGLVIVDASLAFKWLVREKHSDEAREISRSWASEGIRAAAPYLMPVEVANALHRRVVRGELRDPSTLHVRALKLASALSQGAVYDSHYLALAQTLDCELWTADEKFFRMRARLPGTFVG